MGRAFRLIAGAAVALGVGVIGSGLAAIPARAAGGETFYVDCSQTTGQADGTAAAPFHTLAQANALVLAPGQSVLFKRGATCRGTYEPQGEGSTANPVIIGAYGSGDSRPVIDGDGATDTVLVKNMQGIELHGLEVTNSKGPASVRRGVYLLLSDFGTAKHVVVDDVYVHDIAGSDDKDVSGSGGILASVVGDVKASSFDDLQITNNTVEHVDRTGIAAVASVWDDRAQVGDSTIVKPWTANTGVVISGNTVRNVGGDGIVPQTAEGALVEHNTVAGFQLRSAGYNAGVWPWNSDGTVFRYNDVSGGGNTRDGMAFDVDQGTDGTVFEYNYSHDNAGGFLLLCNATGRVSGAIVRYNVSQNDSYRGVENCSGGIASAAVYNNTIYIGPGVSQTVVNENNATRRNVSFRNNIVVKEGAGSATVHVQSGGYAFDHNDFVNVSGALQGAGITADPRLVGRGTGTGIDNATGYRLHESSPAIGSGGVVADNGARDFFGNAVSADDAPNIGAYQGAGVAGSVPPPIQVPVPSIANGGFENGLTGWSTRNASTVTTPAPHSGSAALRLAAPSGSYATAEQSISGLLPGVAYRLTGWVLSDGAPTALGIKGTGLPADLPKESTASTWTQVAIDFVATSGTATVFCYREAVGTAFCDDITLTAADVTAPTTVAHLDVLPNAQGWYTTVPTVSLSAVDDTGVALTEYSVDGGAWTPYAQPFALKDGVTELRYRSTDAAGNVETTRTLDGLQIDSTPPAVSASLPADGRHVAVSATDAGSGIGSVSYSLDGGSTWQDYSAAVPAPDDGFALLAQAVDKAGNVATADPVVIGPVSVSATPAMTVSGSARVGSPLTVTLTGFPANTDVELSVHSAPVHLATLQTDDSGQVVGTVVIPTTVTPGTHTLVASVGDTTLVEKTITVEPANADVTNETADGQDSLAQTGADLALWLIPVALAVIAAGFGMLLVRRRRV